MNRHFARGEASKSLETNMIGLLDGDDVCKISFEKGVCNISSHVHFDGHIALGISNDTPEPSDNTVIWADKDGHVNIRNSLNHSINLFNVTAPLGYSQTNETDGHFIDSELTSTGRGSIQFKKNAYEFGASSQLQYDYGTNTLLISNIAPFESNTGMTFKARDENDTLHEVMKFQPKSTGGGSGADPYDATFITTFHDTTIDLQNQNIYKCGFLGFESLTTHDFKQSSGSARACIYSTSDPGNETTFSEPFTKADNIIIQPKNDNGSVTIPTASNGSNFKKTFVVSDKVVKINPSTNDDDQRFVEFDSNDTKRINIFGQNHDESVWSIVHTITGDLEFQYRNSTDFTTEQKFIFRNVVNDKLYQTPHYTWCAMDDDYYDTNMFRTHITNEPVYIHHNNSKYTFSHSSTHRMETETYTANGFMSFIFPSFENSIAFYLPNSNGFSSISNMVYDHDNSTWVAQSSHFSFHIDTHEFINVYFDNNSLYNQESLLVYDRLQNENGEYKYTSYVNSFTGFLASSTGVFNNNDSDIDFVNIDEVIPTIQKTNNSQSKSVIGMMGRAEKSQNGLERVIYNGQIGTSVQANAYPRMSVIRSGFVGMWVVSKLGEDNINYEVGDLLTSHECGAAIRQCTGSDYNDADYTVRNYTIGKVTVVDTGEVESTANEYPINNGSIRLMGVMLML